MARVVRRCSEDRTTVSTSPTVAWADIGKAYTGANALRVCIECTLVAPLPPGTLYSGYQLGIETPTTSGLRWLPPNASPSLPRRPSRDPLRTDRSGRGHQRNFSSLVQTFPGLRIAAERSIPGSALPPRKTRRHPPQEAPGTRMWPTNHASRRALVRCQHTILTAPSISAIAGTKS